MKKYFATGTRILGVLALILSASVTPELKAQVLYGSVVGTVEDPTGGVIPNATVSLVNKGTGQQLEDKADSGGRYTFSSIVPGSYDLKITSQGFKSQSRTDVTVSEVQDNLLTAVASLADRVAYAVTRTLERRRDIAHVRMV